MIFGLTGGIACGKSTVTKTFRANGIPIVDADQVARDVVRPGSEGWLQVFMAFGKEYLNKDDSLNREKLGALVFSSAEEMKKINHIMKPLIDSEATRQLEYLLNFGELRWNEETKQGELNKPGMVGYDAALIVEMGNADKYRPLIVVSCPPEIQIERLIKRNNLTTEQAQARINSQMPLDEKLKFADFVIDTSGTIENSVKQTENIISKLKEMV